MLWLQIKKNTVKESTYTRYVRTVEKSILPGFETQQLIKIDSTALGLFYDALSKRLSEKTVSDIICIFKSIWNYGFENGYPCCHWNPPKSKSNKNTEVSIIPPESRKDIETALFTHNNLVSLFFLICFQIPLYVRKHNRLFPFLDILLYYKYIQPLFNIYSISFL